MMVSLYTSPVEVMYRGRYGYTEYNLFPPRPGLFVDRYQEVSKVIRYLNPRAAPRGVLIFGLGGTGKTTLAIEAAYRSYQRNDYDELVFLSAQRTYWSLQKNGEAFIPRRKTFQFASFRGMLKRLGNILGIRGRVTQERIAEALAERRILFVVDNLDAIPDEHIGKPLQEFVNFYIPSTCKAIVTARRPVKGISGYGFVEISIEPLPRDATYDLIMQLSREQGMELSHAQVQWIVKESSGNPLVVYHLVSYFAKQRGKESESIVKISEINRTRASLLSYLFQSSIDSLSETAQTILFVVGLSTFPVDIQYLTKILSMPSSEIEKGIAELRDQGLVIDHESSFTVHPLLKEYLVNELKRRGRWEYWMSLLSQFERETIALW